MSSRLVRVLSLPRLSNTLKASVLLLSSSTLLLSACDSFSDANQNQRKKEIDNQRLQAEVALQAHLNEVGKPLSKADNPQIYEEWGSEWIGIINTMLPLAVERVQIHPQCDKVMKVEIAGSSTKGKNPILNVSCQNTENYFVGLNDIANQIKPMPASELFGKSSDEYIQLCKKAIEPELQLPKTLNSNVKATKLSSNKRVREIEVLLPFKVKTSYDTEVSHVVTCTIDSNTDKPKVVQVAWQ